MSMLMLSMVSLLQTFVHILREKNSDLSACHRKLFRGVRTLFKHIEIMTDINFVKLDHRSWFSLIVCFLIHCFQVGRSCFYPENEVL